MKKELAEIYSEIMEHRENNYCYLENENGDHGDCFANPDCPPDCPFERLRTLAGVEAKP